MAASLGVAVGVLWEIAEWLYDHIVTPNVIEGKSDTLIDLILDFTGSLVAGGVSLLMLDSASAEATG